VTKKRKAMENTLMTYLNKRLHQRDTKYPASNIQHGPVICISRQVGCGGVNIANLLANELNQVSLFKKWKVLSKEILEESARELSMDPGKLKSILKEGDRSLFDDVLTAFREKRYKSDRRISKTLIDLMLSFANDGHCIIVGRAGHIISGDIEKSLLVKLTAPHGWRVKQIMEKNNLNIREAVDFIEKTEKERENFRRHIAGDLERDDEFDLTINLSRISMNDVISLIRFAAYTKGLLESNKSKIDVF
jgi:cytidylate kinase